MSQTLRANDPGKFEQNLTASKVNNIERLLNSVDFVSSSIECRTNLNQQRIRFTNGKFEKIPMEKFPLSDALPSVGEDGQLLQSNGTDWVSGWGRMKDI